MNSSLGSTKEMRLYANRSVSRNSRTSSMEPSVPSPSILIQYFELYGIYYERNKKHKGIRKGTKGMDFDNYASHILMLEEAKEGSKRFAKKQKLTLFQTKRGNTAMVPIDKCKFSQLNNKRCILTDGIISFPYGHRNLKFVEEFKDSVVPTPDKLIKHHKNNLLRFKHSVSKSNKRMRRAEQMDKNTRDFLLHGLLWKI